MNRRRRPNGSGAHHHWSGRLDDDQNDRALWAAHLLGMNRSNLVERAIMEFVIRDEDQRYSQSLEKLAADVINIVDRKLQETTAD